MQYLFMALFAGLIVAADQFTKYLTVAKYCVTRTPGFPARHTGLYLCTEHRCRLVLL